MTLSYTFIPAFLAPLAMLLRVLSIRSLLRTASTDTVPLPATRDVTNGPSTLRRI
jgi:hypothetical protein